MILIQTTPGLFIYAKWLLLFSLQEKCRTLATQLQEVQLQLVSEREEAKQSVRQSEFLEKDLLEVSEQSEKIIKSLEKEQRKSNKIEVNSKNCKNGLAILCGYKFKLSVGREVQVKEILKGPIFCFILGRV